MTSRPFIVFHEPYDALCLARTLPGTPLATFGTERQRRELAEVCEDPIVLPPPAELQTLALLADPGVAAAITVAPSLLICFKPSARLASRAAELGSRLALAPPALAQGLENKLALRDLAAQAGVAIPLQDAVRLADTEWGEARDRFGFEVIVQSARGHAGKKTWAIDDVDGWDGVRSSLRGGMARVARRVDGIPGTVGAIVDGTGRVLVTAPIVQVTGHPGLTERPFAACGNDFTWRPDPHPGDAFAEVAEAVGPVLAQRGYRGHFGLDFVYDGQTAWLIEINARLTSSFALYSSGVPRFLTAHLAACREEAIEPGRLPPLLGGQLIAHNVSDGPQPPLALPEAWPHPVALTKPGDKRGRLAIEGSVVAADGSVVASNLRLD